MINLEEVNLTKDTKPQSTYVPELNDFVYTGKDTAGGIAKELSLMKQDGIASSYFGDIDINTKKENVGFFENIALTAPRGLGRGLINLYGSFEKGFSLGGEWLQKQFYEIERSGIWKEKENALNLSLANGEISKEDFDKRKQELDLEISKAVQFDFNNKDIEQQKANELVQKTNLWTSRVIKELGLQKREGEWKTLSAIAESAPSTLTAIGTFLLTKNPALLPVLFGGTTILPQAAEIASREIELGNDLESSLEVGAVTGFSSGSLDFVGLELVTPLWRTPMRQAVTKSKVFNTLQNFVYKNQEKAAVRNMGTYLRLGVVGAVEEGVTEGMQGVIEANIPRYIGKGEAFTSLYNEIMDYGFQAWVGALSGGMFGSIGGAVSLHTVQKNLTNHFQKKNGLSEEDAKVLASQIAPIVVEHGNTITNEITQSAANVDASANGINQAVRNVLEGGLNSEEISYVREGFERTFDAKFPQGKGSGNVVASYIATAAAGIEAEQTGTPLDNPAQKMKDSIGRVDIEVVDNPKGLDVSDKFYNARNKSGDIVGAASKNLSNHIIYLLNNATPDVLVHEMTHIYLNAITHALNSGTVHARFSQSISNVIDVIGVPEGENNVFSERQQELLAEKFQEISKTGFAPNLELQETFADVNKIAKSALAGAKAAGELNPKVKKLFADFFAPFRAPLDIDTSAKTIERLKQAVKDIKQGKRASVSDVSILSKLIRFGRGYRPGWIGYSVEDYIKEHPEYNDLSVPEKRALLEKEGFEIAAERTGFANDDLAINAIEAQPDRVFRLSEKDAIARRKEIAKYEQIAEVYKEVFDNNRLNVLATDRAIRDLRKQGYVVTDKDFIKNLSKDLNALKKTLSESKRQIGELKKLKKEQLAEAKRNADAVINFLYKMEQTLYDSGIDVSVLEDIANKLEEAKKTDSLSVLNEQTDLLLNELEMYSNKMFEDYFKSDFYKEQNGIVPPVVNPVGITGTIVGVITSYMPKLNDGGNIDFSKVFRDIDVALRKKGVPQQTRYKILADLTNNRINIKRGGNIQQIADKIVSDANTAYRRDMTSRNRDNFDALLKEAKKNNLALTDNLAVKAVGDVIAKMRSIEGSRLNKSIEINKIIESLDFNNTPIGKDADGKDVFMNEEQKALASAIISSERTRITDDVNAPNEILMDAYTAIDSFQVYTQERVERIKAEKEEKMKQAIAKAIDTVSKRKGLPSLAQKLDSALFAGPLGGLRSNIIAVFGEDFADLWDVTIDYRLANVKQQKYLNRVNSYIEDIYNKPSQFYKATMETEKPFLNPRNRIEELLSSYNRAQLLDLWLTSKNAKGMRWVERTFGKDAENVIAYLDKHGLKPTDRDFGNYMMEQMKDIYPELAQSYFKINGKPMGFQSDYWPLYVMTRESSDIIQDDIYTFDARPVEKKEANITKQRLEPSTDPTVNPERMLRLEDPFAKFDRYMRTASKFIHVTPRLNQLSQIVRGNTTESQALRNSIEEKFGKGMLDALIADIEYNLGVQPYQPQSGLEKGLNEVLSNFIIGKIAMVPWIAVKQTVAIVNFAERMPTGQFLFGLLQGLAHPVQTWKEMMQYQAVYNRFKGDLPMAFMENKSLQTEMIFGLLNDKQIQKIGERNVAFLAGGISKLKSVAMYNVRIGDAMSVVYGGYSYLQYLKQQIKANPDLNSMSSTEKNTWIEQRLIEMIETSQQSGLESTRGIWQRDDNGYMGALRRGLMTFSSANAQFVRKIREALYEYKNGKISRTQALKTFVIYGLLNPVVFAMLSMPGLWKQMLGAAADGDDEEARKHMYLAFVRPVFDNVFSAYGNVGGIANLFTDGAAKLSGQKTFGIDGDISPFFYKDLARAINSVTKEKEEVSAEEWIDALLAVAQGISPAPLQNIKKMLKGMYGVATDEEAWEKWASAAQVLGISEKQAKQLFEEE